MPSTASSPATTVSAASDPTTSNSTCDLKDSVDNENESESAFKPESSDETMDEEPLRDLPQDSEEQQGEPESSDSEPSNNEEPEGYEFSEPPVNVEDDNTALAPANELPVPVKDDNTPSEPADSSGTLSALKKLGRGVVSKVANLKALVSEPSRVLHKKEIGINLPHGARPKVYSYLVTYKPTDIDKAAKQSPKPLISVTIKPNGKCYREDTHLFVRFADYSYHPK